MTGLGRGVHGIASRKGQQKIGQKTKTKQKRMWCSTSKRMMRKAWFAKERLR